MGGLTKILLFGFISCYMCLQAKPGDIGDLYSSIGARLASIKKQAPSCASIIGGVMDDFDRMYQATRVSQQQDSAAMKELENKTIENASLQKELTAAKQEVELLKQVAQEAQLKIDSLLKEAEKARAQAALLKEQNAQLQQKSGQQQDLISAEISKIDKQFVDRPKDSVVLQNQDGPLGGVLPVNQNLSRSSTSEPSSPR